MTLKEEFKTKVLDKSKEYTDKVVSELSIASPEYVDAAIQADNLQETKWLDTVDEFANLPEVDDDTAYMCVVSDEGAIYFHAPEGEWVSIYEFPKTLTASQIKAIVDEAYIKGEIDYANIVKLAGTQTITGDKTFTGAVVVPTPSANSQAATKAYVDGVAGGLGSDLGETISDLEKYADDAVDVHNEANDAHDDIRQEVATKATDSAVVHKAGSETITGDKTFSGATVKVPAPSVNADVANKKYVDDAVAEVDLTDELQQITEDIDTAIGEHDEDETAHDDIRQEISTKDAQNVKLTGAQSVAGVKTFSNEPIVPTPTSNGAAANKKFVDDAVDAFEAKLSQAIDDACAEFSTENDLD